MAYEIIENCPITQSTATILMPFVDSRNQWYIRNGGYHSGIDISGTHAYSICACVCIYTGYDDNDKNVVVVQYDVNTAFRYANLESVNVTAGQLIESGLLLGTADKFIHFEYWNRTQSQWIARASGETYYKHDPLVYVNGEVNFIDFAEYEIPVSINTDIDLQVEYGILVNIRSGQYDLRFQTSYYRNKTAFEEKFRIHIQPTDTPYICIPIDYRYNNYTAFDLIGYTCALVDHDNDTNCYLLIGDYAPPGTNWSYVSQNVSTKLNYASGIRSMRSNFTLYGDFKNLPDWSNI